MLRFIHAADIHLDSPLRGLERYEGAPVDRIRSASRSAMSNLVRLAIDEQVQFVLIAGDLYDGDWNDFDTGLFFTQCAAELRRANIPLLMIAGNHDAANRMTRSLRLPENVTMFGSVAPSSRIFDEWGVAIHGQSYATRDVWEDLSATFPSACHGMFNIGLLHTSATGRGGHERYAPCTMEGLAAKGYDYWALGHVHTREQLGEQPWIGFSGNLQGRHIRETGPKGCLLVSVDDRMPRVDFHALDVVRWEHLTLSVRECRTADDVWTSLASQFQRLQQEAEGRLLAVRVELRGRLPSQAGDWLRSDQWKNEIRARALDHGRGEIWVERVVVDSLEESNESGWIEGPWGEVSAVLRDLRARPEELTNHPDLTALFQRLPGPVLAALGMDAGGWMDSILAEVELRVRRQMLPPEDL